MQRHLIVQYTTKFRFMTLGGFKIDEPVLGLLEAQIGFVRASGFKR